ncbi:MAG TPA: quinate 5-dehydrogenase [Coriobacteriia bacterium]
MAAIKEVVGVSIGSSKRDHEVVLELLGERVRIRREGTNGDMAEAVRRLRALDGKVDAFGLGGIDLFLRAAGHDYYFRDAMQFKRAVSRTPLVDGSGLKGAVEADVVRFMRQDLGLPLEGKRVLMTSAVDRWGMAQAFYDAGCEMTCADMLYALGIDIMLHDHETLVRFVHALMPVVRRLPFKWLYPAEADHETAVETKHGDLYRDADIIGGDYKYVRKWMPEDMTGKWIVTNTTTAEDVEFLRGRGVELLVTSTPRLEGRSFGTNVMEATLVALAGSKQPLSAEEYTDLLGRIGFRPDVRWLQRERAEAR